MGSPKVGQIWCEQDPRMGCRFVRVISVDSQDGVSIQRVEQTNGAWAPMPLLYQGRVAPVRLAKLSRFNGKRGGYALHEDVQSA